MPPNLMHLAEDLLDPDLDLGTNDLPESKDEDPIGRPSTDDIELEKEEPEPQSNLGRVADYEFVARFQGSDMTDVFLAHKLSQFGFVRRAVVKRAKPDSDLYEISREMLLDEAKALAWLDHPNVVSILDFGEVNDGFYLAMEHVDGTDLRYVNLSLRRRREALPFEIASYLAIEVLRGLHHAHTLVDPDGQALDILHRDVNPTNVLISNSGHVKLTDFGVVRMRDRLQAKTEPGIVKGKFSYMAREYILGRKCDCRVDVYAVGIMLLEMLTGRPCFTKMSVHDVMKKIVEHELPIHRMSDQEIPERLCKIVTKATAREPEDRYDSAANMANDLETWLMRSGGHASPWIVSAFFEQHDLFRRQNPKKEQAVTSAAPEEQNSEDPVKPVSAEPQEPAEKPIETGKEQNAAPAKNQKPEASETAVDQVLPDKTTVSEAPIRLQPVDDSYIIELDDADVEEEEEESDYGISPDDEWEGTIKEHSVADVLEALIRSRAEGEIFFENRAVWKRIYISKGQCVAVSSNAGMEELAELLVQQKALTRAELDRMMLGGKLSDQELGLRLIKEERITPERFAKIHGQQIQACLEDVLAWRNGTFIFEPQDVELPEVTPSLHIELLILPHLGESNRKKTPGNPKGTRTKKGAPETGSLADALRMARKVTRGNINGRIERINADDD